ncbi:MAG: ABC transporter permease [Crocinitomicaceae bacterium]|nr:ABC transporter permease [Crocinitomicaceae bacterium]
MYFSRKVWSTLAYEYFISKKTLKSVVQGKKVSKPIVRISIISIALAVIVNLITIAVVTGFQQEVRQKVSGFGSHIFIMASGENSIYESSPIRKDQPILEQLKNDPGIRSVNAVGYKPVLFQSNRQEISYTLPNGTDTTESQYQVYGALIKGVDSSYDWSFFESHLIEGILPNYSLDSTRNHIVISKHLAQKLNYEIGQDVGAFFVKNSPVKRKYRIKGIYETGLEELDKQIVLGNLNTVQELNDWGIKASIQIEDTLVNGNQLIISADVSGGNGNYRYDWGKGYATYYGFSLCPTKDTVIRLIASDYWSNINASYNETTLPDTAYLKITVNGDITAPCNFGFNDFGELEREYSEEDPFSYVISDGNKTITCSFTNGLGSAHNYIGGYEIMVNDWSTLNEVVERTKDRTDFLLTPFDETLTTTSIIDNQPDIFIWLGFLDINVWIILSLMILIGIINMGSALLVLILVRSNFIGMMKAMGATNGSIRKIFLIQAGFLIGRGILWGNIIGLMLCLIQKYTGILSLNSEVYYLTQVPIELNIWHWILLNLGTFVVCILALILPSLAIARVNPVKAIKFN